MELDEWLDGAKPSCVLDVAASGGQTLEDIGAIMGFTRERTRQIETMAFDAMRLENPDVAEEMRG